MSQKEPVFNVPGIVLVMLALIAGVHGVRALLSPEDDAWFVLSLALIPARLAGAAQELPGGAPAEFTQFLTYMLVHGDLTHLVLNGAWLLVFGGAIAQRVGGARLVAFTLAAGLAGAVFFVALNPRLLAPVVGASGAISGMMGATMRFFFPALDMGGLWLLREAPHSVPLMPLAVALRDRRILTTTGVWLALNLLAVLGVGSLGPEGGIAWEAHVGGYLFGLLAFGAFDRSQTIPAERRFTVH